MRTGSLEMSNSLQDRRPDATPTCSLKSFPGTLNVLRNRKDKDYGITFVSQANTNASALSLLECKAKLKPKLGGNKDDKHDDDEVSSLPESIYCVKEKFVLLIC